MERVWAAWRRRWGLAALLALLLALAALAYAWLGDDGALARVQRAGVLRVGYAVEAPYAMRDARGEVVGEAPELARLVAQALGLARIEWVQTSFEDLIPGLQARRFDVVAAGMFVTPERARQVLFSDPSVRVLPGLLVRQGNPLHLRGEADLLERAGLRVAALKGSVEAARLAGLGLGGERLLLVEDAQAGRTALESGAADALCLSLPTVRWQANERPGSLQALRLRQLGGAPALGYAAFQFNRQDLTLQQAWIRAQAALMGSPRHLQAIARYGFTPEDLPGAVRSVHLVEP